MSQAVWKKVGIDIETAKATALPISAISKASQAVVSYTGTDPVPGDYIRLTDIVGMSQVSNMIVRALSVDGTANTFVCEGLDSTLFDTFVSGNAEVLTFGQSMSTARDVSPSGGEPHYADTTTIHDETDTQIPVGFSAIKFDVKSLFSPADSALLALRAASRAKTPLAIKFRFANGAKIAFNSYIAAPLNPAGSSGQAVETPISFNVIGTPNTWAS